MIDLTQVATALISLVIALVSAFLVPYLKNRLTTSQFNTMVSWVNIAVEAAEMIYTGSGRGEEKKEYVVNFLNEKGFSLNSNEIDTLIESAVLELKQAQK